MVDTEVSETQSAQGFVTYLDHFVADLEPVLVSSLIEEAAGPEHVALACVDVIVGFCEAGPLASQRVGAIVSPICRLIDRLYDAGITKYVMCQDAHSESTPEFRSFPAHCIRGTAQSHMVEPLRMLRASAHFDTFEKNSISSAIGTGLDVWLAAHAEVTHYIVVGDCTDLCVYQLAMYLRMLANASNDASRQVIVPANCVDTFDTPLDAAKELGIMPHPGDLCHAFGLYHMALNGIRVVRSMS